MKTLKKNPLHSYLYREYKKQVYQINALQSEIQSYKNFLNIQGNYFKSSNAIKALNQTREKLKYHQSIAKYLKHQIRYCNNKTGIILIIPPKSIKVTFTVSDSNTTPQNTIK